MNSFSLARTGTSQLSFRGELLAEADSQGRQGPAENRWFELAVYRTDSGKYVTSIGYRSRWQGELDQDAAVVHETPAAVRDYLTDFNPCDPALWRGIPENVHDAERKNSYYRDAISAAYRSAVSRVLADREFAEVI